MASGPGSYLTAGISTGIGNFLRRKLNEKRSAEENAARMAQEDAVMQMKEESDMRRMAKEYEYKKSLLKTETQKPTEIRDPRTGEIMATAPAGVDVKFGQSTPSPKDEWLALQKAKADITGNVVVGKELRSPFSEVETAPGKSFFKPWTWLNQRETITPAQSAVSAIDRLAMSGAEPAKFKGLFDAISPSLPEQDRPAVMQYIDYTLRQKGYNGPIPNDVPLPQPTVMVKGPASQTGMSNKAEASQKGTVKSKYNLK